MNAARLGFSWAWSSPLLHVSCNGGQTVVSEGREKSSMILMGVEPTPIEIIELFCLKCLAYYNTSEGKNAYVFELLLFS